ncbi:flagellin [Microbacterium sp. STN6]|uniref:flagellin N-terminal helical domain-containing protein n=1 Tax=Microbacterium sp. STN6 TaxID=2995588 RepID=UPI0022608453|nr:flagellin [Microbacterium sp. STN6]MCX7522372.1 flagellin [Microbacterium sp. STN6]
MGMTINTNISALNTYRNLSNTQNDLSKSLEKLSSGLRINRAADDAAGLAISEGLKSQIGGLTVAARNSQDGISVIQTTEGSLTEVQSILQRMRDLAVQAGNDSNNADSRKAISTEASALNDELTRISQSSNFNGINLLDGTAGTNGKLAFQVGANGTAADQITVDLSSANVATIASALGVGNTGGNFTAAPATVAGAQAFSVANGDGSVTAVTTAALSGTYATAGDVADALNADKTFSANLIATVNAAGDLNVKSLTGGTVSVAAAPGTGLTAATTQPAAATGGLDFTSATGAQAAIKLLDTQITKVSTARAQLGADQNRFEHTINNLNVSKENLSASSSRITDTDMASEMVNYTRANILSQAGTAMLAQANQSNQGVLQLLR